ncbi:MAG: DUF4194 domain-containing protein [Spirochaetaceae bacterium]|nr:DUF4194 domain-containing protein [Spirochaetaceae bacterium]
MNPHKDELPTILIPLLKGVIYRDESPGKWQNLLDNQGPLRDYLTVIGLDLMVFEDEGFAYLKNCEEEDDDETPKLISRRPLSYTVSLLLSQLRRKLAEHDASSGEERLILEKQEIVELMGTFLSRGVNEVQFTRKIEAALQKVFELGFIRFPGDKKDRVEVKRIIKAFVDAQWLNEFDSRMEAYTAYGKSDEE